MMRMMEALEKLFHSLANKNRLRILNLLAEEHSPMTFTQLKNTLDLNPNTLSFHLEVLKDCGLVRNSLRRTNSGYSYYELTERGMGYISLSSQ